MCAVTWALLAALVVARSAAEEPALRCRHARCRYLGPDNNHRTRYEVDDNRMTIIYKVNQLIMECNGASVLESPGLPRADPALRVASIQLTGCPLPAAGSLSDTLAALNLTLNCSEPGARAELSLTHLPPEPPLATEHFARLECLVHLKVSGNGNTHPSLERGLLSSLRRLRWLVLGAVLLPTGELDLPPSVRQLRVYYDFEGMKRLLVTPTLEQFYMRGWTEPRPAPLADCDALRLLDLVAPAVTALPNEWLANCSHLEVIRIELANHLTTLPPKLFVGVSALTNLTIYYGKLETLPTGLLDYSPNLRKLRLENNRLRTLPSDMFGVARWVQDINLSSNELDSSAMDALAPLEELVELDLQLNPRLSNVCATDGYSPIRNSTKLRKLLLASTGVNQICRDWRQDMTVLEKLELSFTELSRLSFKDIQFTRTVKSEVVIYDTPLKALETTREDYDNAARGLAGDARVRFTYITGEPELECDCRMYWTRRALDLSLPALYQFGYLRCTNDRRLSDVPPEDMVCARPEVCAEAELPAACECSMWAAEPADDPDHDPRLVRVRCERAELYSVPRPRDNSTERLYELQLAHNRITDLHADDLQHNIKGIDLRNNFLREVDEETARRLGDINGMLRLAGNPLECSCRAAPLLRALHARNATQTDLSNATCSDGSPLEDTPIVECLPVESPAVLLNIWLLGGLAALLVLALAAVAILASRERRFFLLAALHRWGLWRAAESDEDDGCRFDAFVTFSHKDQATVLELVARLEPPYRLCVHYRDWIPGSFISEQVVGSVRESRRTVALVSRHFLASSWARAEFREAHEAAMQDARPRLIVVLLEDPNELEMDEQLRRYVATHTYLRWGETWFWDKLAVALPRPRAPRAPEPAPLALPAAPTLELNTAPA